MTLEQYNKYEDEFLKFDRVQNKFSNRHDLHAFILLDRLFPSDISIISAATHDQIWLGIDSEALSKVATEEQIIELIRCGIMYDESTDSLTMFV